MNGRLKPQPGSATQEVLAGLVERVTFHNAENGFCVIRIKARGHRELVTAVGHAATIAAGEWVTASGEWVNERTHGQQFKSRFMRTSAPTTTEGIEKYLGSGMIRGIGPVYAKKMVKAFGDKVFDVIEAEPHRLREVTGIGPMRAKRITGAWAEQKIVRESPPPVMPWQSILLRMRLHKMRPTFGTNTGKLNNEISVNYCATSSATRSVP